MGWSCTWEVSWMSEWQLGTVRCTKRKAPETGKGGLARCPHHPSGGLSPRFGSATRVPGHLQRAPWHLASWSRLARGQCCIQSRAVGSAPWHPHCKDLPSTGALCPSRPSSLGAGLQPGTSPATPTSGRAKYMEPGTARPPRSPSIHARLLLLPRGLGSRLRKPRRPRPGRCRSLGEGGPHQSAPRGAGARSCRQRLGTPDHPGVPTDP